MEILQNDKSTSVVEKTCNSSCFLLSAKISLMQESKEPIEFTETVRPADELDVQEEVWTFYLNVSVIYRIQLVLFLYSTEPCC